MTEGSKGGDVNRPGSRPEINKLPTDRCARCGLVAVKPIVVASLCTNGIACQLRIDRAKREKAK